MMSILLLQTPAEAGMVPREAIALLLAARRVHDDVVSPLGPNFLCESLLILSLVPLCLAPWWNQAIPFHPFLSYSVVLFCLVLYKGIVS